MRRFSTKRATHFVPLRLRAPKTRALRIGRSQEPRGSQILFEDSFDALYVGVGTISGAGDLYWSYGYVEI